MKRTYEVADRTDKQAITEFLKREGQFLLPMVELVEQAEVAMDEVIDVMGRATIGAVLEMSAEGVAGPQTGGQEAGGGLGGLVRAPGRPGVPVGPEGSGGAPPSPAEGRGPGG